ncbi:peptidoglycan DD-metalloendopeptidase family protein [Devosia sp. SD17-2]|uniref:peptidoglycan DD-metalloendopeptidase family protein n=1 Tax=Devosia sp. SD17-2 TaxID=2976459 RepID=UPI0023D7DD03|nr:peptidoglycan DD-metalloendopeptidase family protein [Devosia sp. SD17-2]WEJ31682.1 peptidoglycan DD-metalloendopeptidase family protein [Devosia sp. SD17-2]
MRQSASFGEKDKSARPVRKGIHPALFYGMFTLLLGANGLTATGLLMAPDIARLLNAQSEQVIGAYEDRIAQMRVEIDRLHSRNYAQAGDINLQLQELSAQQDVLLEQHQLVRALVDKADQLGIAAVSISDAPATEQLASTNASGNPDIVATAESLEQMMSETHRAMTGIAEAATERTDGIVIEMRQLGIAMALPDLGELGMGGPLLPAAEGMESSPMVEDANAVMAALLRYKAARESVEAAPIHMPMTGNYRNSSGYGNRKDPFTGGRAFHAGLDFAAPTGTTVFSAAKGVVSFVGTKSGYGKVVEVTHATGHITRYAHLSGYLAREGQSVNAGTPIAKVGSTGRSTGPHLHFEIRKGDAPIDPRTFLAAGKRVQALLG